MRRHAPLPHPAERIKLLTTRWQRGMGLWQSGRRRRPDAARSEFDLVLMRTADRAASRASISARVTGATRWAASGLTTASRGPCHPTGAGLMAAEAKLRLKRRIVDIDTHMWNCDVNCQPPDNGVPTNGRGRQATKPKTHYHVPNAGRSSEMGGTMTGLDKWNTMEQWPHSGTQRARLRGRATRQGWRSSDHVGAVKSFQQRRIFSGLSEFDRVLGGGLVEDGNVIPRRQPGRRENPRCSSRRVAMSPARTSRSTSRARRALPSSRSVATACRCRTTGCWQSPETDVTAIGAYLERERPSLAIVNSIQSCYHPELDANPEHQPNENMRRLFEPDGKTPLCLAGSCRPHQQVGDPCRADDPHAHCGLLLAPLLDR